jgi:hypothetical protein
MPAASVSMIACTQGNQKSPMTVASASMVSPGCWHMYYDA